MAVSDHVDLEQFVAGVEKRNPGQPEFVQAVHEVAEDIFDFIADKEQGRISEYVDEFKGATYHDGERPWAVPCDLAAPCATQNELNGDDAKTLVKNGCIGVSEGANMPTDLDGVHAFKEAQIL